MGFGISELSSEKGCEEEDPNTMFDWLASTGVAQADRKIERRYYRERKGR